MMTINEIKKAMKASTAEISQRQSYIMNATPKALFLKRPLVDKSRMKNSSVPGDMIISDIQNDDSYLLPGEVVYKDTH